MSGRGSTIRQSSTLIYLWHRREIDQPIILEDGEAWILPLSNFFTTRELTELDEEDAEKVKWKVSFEYSHGAYFPFRHLNSFFALDPRKLQASVSHYSQHDEGKHLFLLAEPMEDVPTRFFNLQQLVPYCSFKGSIF